MDDVVLESVVQVLIPVLYAVGTIGATAAGLFAELTALQSISGGELTFGLWLAVVGVLGLYVGLYLFGHQRLLPAIRRTAN